MGYQDETMVSHHMKVSYHKIHDQVAWGCGSMDLTIIDDLGVEIQGLFFKLAVVSQLVEGLVS